MRGGWSALALLIAGLYGASLPLYVAFLQTPCVGAACAIDGALTSADIHTLLQAGLALGSYTAIAVASYAARILVGCAIGGMIAWRRSNDWMALLVALILFALAFGNRDAPPDLLPLANTVWWLPVHLVHALSSVALYLFFFLFPTGHIVPRWTRWLAAVYVVQTLAEFALPPESPVNFENWPAGFAVLYYLPLFLTALFAQVYRYRYVSTAAQRQQTKWVVLGVIGTAGGLLGVSILLLLFPVFQDSRNLIDLLSGLFVLTLPIFLAVCVGVAVLHSRLFDLDAIINRALVYGTLTAIIAAVYTSVVLGTQAVVQALTGQAEQQAVFIVATTLLIAALFNPLRRAIQTTIDRHFYRRKYDAAKTLAAFGAAQRNEVDLEQLREHLVAVVYETMQPAHVSLWLRPLERHDATGSNRALPS